MVTWIPDNRTLEMRDRSWRVILPSPLVAYRRGSYIAPGEARRGLFEVLGSGVRATVTQQVMFRAVLDKFSYGILPLQPGQGVLLLLRCFRCVLRTAVKCALTGCKVASEVTVKCALTGSKVCSEVALKVYKDLFPCGDLTNFLRSREWFVSVLDKNIF